MSIVGHANSGKSTLLQQLTGRRMYSVISDGAYTTEGILFGKMPFQDRVDLTICDTPAYDKTDDFLLANSILRTKVLCVMIDPFGFQPTLESEHRSALEMIRDFTEMYTRCSDPHERQFDPKIVLCFNKLDLPGAQEKMQETVEQLNNESFRLNFSKILAISANEKMGLDKLKDYARSIADEHYEKYKLGREYRALAASGKKWPPPSLKGPDAPVLLEAPDKELLYQNIKPRTGGDMNLVTNGKQSQKPVQSFARFVQEKVDKKRDAEDREKMKKWSEKQAYKELKRARLEQQKSQGKFEKFERRSKSLPPKFEKSSPPQYEDIAAIQKFNRKNKNRRDSKWNENSATSVSSKDLMRDYKQKRAILERESAKYAEKEEKYEPDEATKWSRRNHEHNKEFKNYKSSEKKKSFQNRRSRSLSKRQLS